jgi:hypothetical protein
LFSGCSERGTCNQAWHYREHAQRQQRRHRHYFFLYLEFLHAFFFRGFLSVFFVFCRIFLVFSAVGFSFLP